MIFFEKLVYDYLKGNELTLASSNYKKEIKGDQSSMSYIPPNCERQFKQHPHYWKYI